MKGSAVFRRLRQAGALADLRPEYRLHAKLDMSPQGISRRLRHVESLRRACNRLAALRARDGRV